MVAVQKDLGYPNGDPRNGTAFYREVYLRPDAATTLEELDDEFLAEFGYRIPLLEGLRSIADQQYYWDRYQGRWTGWTVAAVPGTSNHGWGLALDFGSPLNSSNSAEHDWLTEHCERLGWYWAGSAFGEPWHFEFDGRNVSQQWLDDRQKQPVRKDGFLMALSDTQQAEMWAALVARTSGGDYYKTDALISVMRNELGPQIEAIRKGEIFYPGAGYYAFIAVINSIRTERGKRSLLDVEDLRDAIVSANSKLGKSPTVTEFAQALKEALEL